MVRDSVSNIPMNAFRLNFNIFFCFTETISKSKLLRKSVHLVLIASLEKAIWNWMDTYPHEFTEIQVRNVILKKKTFNSCIIPIVVEMS